MNWRLAWQVLRGKCDWCKTKVPLEELKHCLRAAGGRSYCLRCPKCAGQNDVSEMESFLYLVKDKCTTYREQIQVYLKASKHVFKRLSKMVQAYNTVAKSLGHESVCHPSLLISIERETVCHALHPCIRYGSVMEDFELDLLALDVSYSEAVETALAQYGKHVWNLLALKTLLEHVVKEHNDLVGKLKAMVPSETREAIQIDNVLQEIAARLCVEEAEIVDP